MKRNTQKPEGQPTRGKTAANRLRRVDNFILLYEPALLTRTDGLFSDSLFVDLGYGFDARTTLESAVRFRRANANLRILGVEIDKERVEAALPFADEQTFFRLGGFNLPLASGEHVRLIRAFNVLRQYEEKDFAPAYERLAEYVLPGGLMIEGTSTPFGKSLGGESASLRWSRSMVFRGAGFQYQLPRWFRCRRISDHPAKESYSPCGEGRADP
ncbi:MAG: hypothetical protein IPJ47_19330 [Anaerolineales bacterium]|nr:hypothetical protein [Anaerolineales bacterium]